MAYPFEDSAAKRYVSKLPAEPTLKDKFMPPRKTRPLADPPVFRDSGPTSSKNPSGNSVRSGNGNSSSLNNSSGIGGDSVGVNSSSNGGVNSSSVPRKSASPLVMERCIKSNRPVGKISSHYLRQKEEEIRDGVLHLKPVFHHRPDVLFVQVSSTVYTSNHFVVSVSMLIGRSVTLFSCDPRFCLYSIQFPTPEIAKQALEKLNFHDVKGVSATREMKHFLRPPPAADTLAEDHNNKMIGNWYAQGGKVQDGRGVLGGGYGGSGDIREQSKSSSKHSGSYSAKLTDPQRLRGTAASIAVNAFTEADAPLDGSDPFGFELIGGKSRSGSRSEGEGEEVIMKPRSDSALGIKPVSAGGAGGGWTMPRSDFALGNKPASAGGGVGGGGGIHASESTSFLPRSVTQSVKYASNPSPQGKRESRSSLLGPGPSISSPRDSGRDNSAKGVIDHISQMLNRLSLEREQFDNEMRKARKELEYDRMKIASERRKIAAERSKLEFIEELRRELRKSVRRKDGCLVLVIERRLFVMMKLGQQADCLPSLLNFGLFLRIEPPKIEWFSNITY